jgi:PadR family transcriptional regulator
MKETDIRQGTLALIVLKTLEILGSLHGYATARRIEQISGELLAVNQGTLYPHVPYSTIDTQHSEQLRG